MADPIANLPVDDTPEIPEDSQILQRFVMLEHQKDNAKLLFASNRDILVVTALFFVMSLPAVDSLIERLYPSCAGSFYYRLGVKALVFLIIIFVLNNMSHILKSSK
jgi:hypothetical protein